MNTLTFLCRLSLGPFTLALLVLATFFAANAPKLTAEDSPSEEARSGLVTTFFQSGTPIASRLDSHPAFRGPSKKASQVQWEGMLRTQAPGNYRFAILSKQEVRLSLNGQPATLKKVSDTAWQISDAMMLEADDVPFQLQMDIDAASGSEPKLQLFWSGPGFTWEIVSPKFFQHLARPDDARELQAHGEQLSLALRCNRCHQSEITKSELVKQEIPGPSLMHASEHLHAQWMMKLLQATRPESRKPQEATGEEEEDAENVELPIPARRMPYFALSEADAKAVVAALLNNSPSPLPASAKNAQGNEQIAQAKKGEELFTSVGCLACHRWQGLGHTELWDGGELTSIAQKRPASFFADWLRDPQKLNPQHRMPQMELTGAEQEALATFLKRQGLPAEEAFTFSEEQRKHGRKLVRSLGCASCHELSPEQVEAPSESSPSRIAKPLTNDSSWEHGCQASHQDSLGSISYHLEASDIAAVKAYYKSHSNLEATPALPGKLLFQTRGCTACHARDEFPSSSGQHPFARQTLGLTKRYASLADKMAYLLPPSLASVGDKLEDEALNSAIRRKGPAYRDYLLVRMPKFNLNDAELTALTDYFRLMDRLPERPPVEGATSLNQADAKSPEETAQHRVAGTRLVTTSGFGCTSCHQVGSAQPAKATAAARGPQLVGMDSRLRRIWFDRWVRNPSRIVPRMEMPSVALPVGGVLEQKLDKQLAAVWLVLNTPGFEPPLSAPVRILRHSGKEQDASAPWVLTDVLKTPTRTYSRPFAVGLTNRHNVLFDAESGSLTAWWLGDFAQQITQGKTWFWQPGGAMVAGGGAASSSEWSLQLKSREILPPAAAPQFISIPESWSLQDPHSSSLSQLTWKHAYQFALLEEDKENATTASVIVHEKLWKANNGFYREFQWKPAQLPADSVLRLVPHVGLSKAKAISADGNLLTLEGDSRVQVKIESPQELRFQVDGSLLLKDQTKVTLKYITPLEADTAPEEAQSPFVAADETIPLQLGPGLVAQRLPLPGEIMPTGLALDAENGLYFCTLKGEAFKVNLSRFHQDKAAPLEITKLADGLPAPYGIAVHQGQVDVLTKPALLRLNPQTSEFTSLCSDWGYTTDYHDWAVGLVPESSGVYIAALPAQQDERSLAAARHRGECVRLVPLRENPQQYRLEEISRGHRFPMGIARLANGDIFVTDNQGNYNPYNELNHVRPGAHFGFINSLDRPAAKLHPPQVTPAAIEIPHPWTRSVNGLCFLSLGNDDASKKAFGPFAGDLLGCEYDTRRLVRMTLDPVGDSYQGGVYPFTQVPEGLEQGLLGPLVAAVSPSGEILVGNIRDSGWGAGNNIGDIVSLSIDSQKLPGGIRRIRPTIAGFEIEFLRPVDLQAASLPTNYRVTSARRESTPAYGGPDLQQRSEAVQSVTVSEDGMRATLSLAELREGFVYDFQLKNLMPKGQAFFPAEAFYTLRFKPQK